jgi:hypothetical protein
VNELIGIAERLGVMVVRCWTIAFFAVVGGAAVVWAYAMPVVVAISIGQIGTNSVSTGAIDPWGIQLWLGSIAVLALYAMTMIVITFKYGVIAQFVCSPPVFCPSNGTLASNGIFKQTIALKDAVCVSVNISDQDDDLSGPLNDHMIVTDGRRRVVIWDTKGVLTPEGTSITFHDVRKRFQRIVCKDCIFVGTSIGRCTSFTNSCSFSVSPDELAFNIRLYLNLLLLNLIYLGIAAIKPQPLVVFSGIIGVVIPALAVLFLVQNTDQSLRIRGNTAGAVQYLLILRALLAGERRHMALLTMFTHSRLRAMIPLIKPRELHQFNKGWWEVLIDKVCDDVSARDTELIEPLRGLQSASQF